MKERDVRAKLTRICQRIDARRGGGRRVVGAAGALLPVIVGMGLAGTACEDERHLEGPIEALYGVGGWTTTTTTATGGSSGGSNPGGYGGEGGTEQGGSGQGGSEGGSGQGGSGQGGSEQGGSGQGGGSGGND